MAHYQPIQDPWDTTTIIAVLPSAVCHQSGYRQGQPRKLCSYWPFCMNDHCHFVHVALLPCSPIANPSMRVFLHPQTREFEFSRTQGFLHRFHAVRTPMLEIPRSGLGIQCRNYANGNCPDGVTCSFMHFRLPQGPPQPPHPQPPHPQPPHPQPPHPQPPHPQPPQDPAPPHPQAPQDPNLNDDDNRSMETRVSSTLVLGDIDEIATTKLSATERKFRVCLMHEKCMDFFCEYSTAEGHPNPCPKAEECDDPKCECLHPEMSTESLEELRERLAYVRGELRAAAAPRDDPNNEALANSNLYNQDDAISPFVRSLCLVALFAAFEGWQGTFFADARGPSVEALVSAKQAAEKTLSISDTFTKAWKACQQQVNAEVNAGDLKVKLNEIATVPKFSPKLKEFFSTEVAYFGVAGSMLSEKHFKVTVAVENTVFSNNNDTDGNNNNDDDNVNNVLDERATREYTLNRFDQEAFLCACYAARCVISHGGSRFHWALEYANAHVPNMTDSDAKGCAQRLVKALAQHGFRASPSIRDLVSIDNTLRAIALHYTRLRVYVQVKVLESIASCPARYCRKMGYHVRQVKAFFEELAAEPGASIACATGQGEANEEKEE